MSKWRVRYEVTIYFDNEEDDPVMGWRWCVYSPHGVPWGTYGTWREAMQRADKQARTVTVTLPRDANTIPLPASVEKEEKPLTLTRWRDFVMVEASAQGDGQSLFVHNDELEPLALALLAHARKEKK